MVHNKTTDLPCTLCGYTTSSSGSLSMHIKSMHKDIKKCHCILWDYAAQYTMDNTQNNGLVVSTTIKLFNDMNLVIMQTPAHMKSKKWHLI